ncbi:thiamine pyrophosphate-binding protein [Motilibacter aurantiacus]|uniref:thiamine pyrophosphate-binding protein n=1 Tax=Motilibacter aurantiacus TaxID=2714955 RepID=UPI00140B7640|nr:thiamine pyrophosphate-binding protein [Motilibacter aurantiacus]NHC43770.1 thiamine pyrophosphate-binding protein [Motilibacter aurantiacus]
MLVAEAVGRTLALLGCDTVFGVVGSGNFHVTNALVAEGARFVAARHEGGAATMADAYARTSGKVGVLSLHQGCGLTNALTGITEAAKSRTPLVVLAAEATSPRSNFAVDQDALAAAVGAAPERVASGGSAVQDVMRAFRRARDERRTVVLNLPLDVQAELSGRLPEAAVAGLPPGPQPLRPRPQDVARLADALAAADRPVFIAGRGARSPAARDRLLELADATGALVATSAVSKGLFASSPWSLDVSGGFASPLAAELIAGSDLVVGWGCSLNMWTLRHGRLIGPGAAVAQVDADPAALGAYVPVRVGVVGDVAVTAAAVTHELQARFRQARGWRTAVLRDRLSRRIRWRDVAYDDGSARGRIDPRTLTIALDDLLPAERVVAVDSGNFMGYPSMFLSVPDENGFCFTQAFQSVGLGLATAIGAALARPDRLPVAALGDGGALMGASELETAVRLGLGMVVVVYDDAAYGAEVHHFGPDGHPLDNVQFPEADIAAIGRGFGCEAVTVRSREDLRGVREWLEGPRDRPLLLDAKVTRDRASWWLDEAFRGH